jgi:hypothetical protein
MNWRRGLLLAGIHLAVAVPLILSLEARDAKYLRNRHISVSPPVQTSQPAAQEGETVSFSPCGMWVHYPPQTVIVNFANIPAFILTGWQMECPPHWSLSGRLHADWKHRTIESQRQVNIGLVILIAIQWILVGSFPLRKPVRWWEEHGIIITLCTVASGLLVQIPNDGYDALPTAPMLIAGLIWFWWFGLLVWKTLRSGWWLAKRGIEHLR